MASFMSNPYVECSQYELEQAPRHMIDAEDWEGAEAFLTDLQFIEAKCRAGLAYDLQSDYETAVDRWPGYRRWTPFDGPPTEPTPAWMEKGIQGVLAGVSENARQESHEMTGTDLEEPWSEPQAVVREDDTTDGTPELVGRYFGRECGTARTLAVMRGCSDQVKYEPKTEVDDSAAARVAAFGAFVRSHVHLLEATPSEVIAIAQNSASGGIVASAAAEFLQGCTRGVWLARDPRPPADPERPLILRRLSGHTDTVYAVAMTLDGRRIVSGGADGALRVWDAVSGKCEHVLEASTGQVRGVGMSTDGMRAVSFADEDEARLRTWDLRIGCLRQASAGCRSGVQGLAVSADCRLIVTVHEDRRLRVWDGESCRCVRTLSDDTYYPTGSVSVTWDGRIAVTPAQEHRKSQPSPDRILIWDVASGRVLRVLETGVRRYCVAIVTADGRLVFSGDFTNKIGVWDVSTGCCLGGYQVPVDGGILRIRNIDGEPTDSLRGLAASPDGRILLTCSANARWIWLQDVGAGRGARLRGQDTFAGGVCISGNGSIGASCAGKSVYVWNIATGVEPGRLPGHRGRVRHVALSGDGNRVCTSGEDNAVRTWDADSGACSKGRKGIPGRAGEVALTWDGNLAVAALQHEIAFWDAEGQQPRRASIGAKLRSTRIALTADESMAVSAQSAGSVGSSANSDLRIWRVGTGECVRVIPTDGRELGDMLLTCDGRAAIANVGRHDAPEICVWDLVTGACCCRLRPASAVTCFALSPDGVLLASAECDVGVTLWHIPSGSELKRLWGHRDLMRDIRFTPDGRTLVTAGQDGTVRLWEPGTGLCRATFDGHRGTVVAVRITPDGSHALSLGTDGTLRVWDLEECECVCVYHGTAILDPGIFSPEHAAGCLSHVTPHGRIVFGSKDGELHFLQLKGGQLGPPYVTATRLFRYAGAQMRKHDDGQRTGSASGEGQCLPGDCGDEWSVRCPWCGVRFPVSSHIQEAIGDMRFSGHAFGTATCLDLPQSAWDISRLRFACPVCRQEVCLNPFVCSSVSSVATQVISREPAGTRVPGDQLANRQVGGMPGICVICGGNCRSGTPCDGVGRECLWSAIDDAEREWAEFSGKGSVPCVVCTKTPGGTPGSYLLTQRGWLCPTCIRRMLREACGEVDVAGWSKQEIIESLGPGAPLRSKLPVLWRFDAVVRRFTGEGPTPIEDIFAAVVEHLGYGEHRWLGVTVRQAALDACITGGVAALGALLEVARTRRTESQILYLNALEAASAIAPSDMRVRSLFEEASQDSAPEIRRKVIRILSKYAFPWIGEVLKRLARDPVEAIRKEVRKAHATWQAKVSCSAARPPKVGQNRSEDSIVSPTSQELSVLPRSACVAFAGRCALKLLPAFMSWSHGRGEQFAALRRATVLVLKLSAARGEAKDDAALRHEVEAALRDAQNGYNDARIAEDEVLLQQTSQAVVAAEGILHALRAASAGDPFSAAHFAAKALQCVITLAQSPLNPSQATEQAPPVGDELTEEYRRLREASSRESWTDSSPIPVDFFGTSPFDNTW